MDVGFTGTRDGMTERQKARIEELLLQYRPLAVHHGDCVGADAEFHEMVRRLLPEAVIHVHPPDNPRLRAYCEGDIIWTPKPYMKRNWDIVRQSQMLFAAPKTKKWVSGSGTWKTIKYASHAVNKRPVRTAFP
jgi:hypothetical protein